MSDETSEKDMSPDVPNRSVWARFRSWVKKPQGISAAVLGGLIVAALSYFIPGAFHGGGQALHIVSSPGPISVDAVPVACGDPSPSVLDPWWLFPVGTTPEGARFPRCGPALDAWALAHHAIPANHLIYRVTVRANQPEPVVVDGVTVSVQHSGPAVNGWYVGPNEGCGPITARLINVDLDRSPPRISYAMDAANPGALSRTFNLSVSEDDPEVLYVVATTTSADVTWRPYLEYEYASHQSSVALTDTPLQITAVSSSDHSYDADGARTPSMDGRTTLC